PPGIHEPVPVIARVARVRLIPTLGRAVPAHDRRPAEGIVAVFLQAVAIPVQHEAHISVLIVMVTQTSHSYLIAKENLIRPAPVNVPGLEVTRSIPLHRRLPPIVGKKPGLPAEAPLYAPPEPVIDELRVAITSTGELALCIVVVCPTAPRGIGGQVEIAVVAHPLPRDTGVLVQVIGRKSRQRSVLIHRVGPCAIQRCQVIGCQTSPGRLGYRSNRIRRYTTSSNSSRRCGKARCAGYNRSAPRTPRRIPGPRGYHRHPPAYSLSESDSRPGSAPPRLCGWLRRSQRR